MDGGWAIVISALISAFGGIAVVVFAQMKKENKNDHAVVAGMLQHIYRATARVETKVEKVDSKLNTHIEDHPKVT
jgi:hypothetical protein